MKPEMNTFPGWMKAALAAVLLALLAGGAWFYKAQEQEQRRQVEGQLQAIARLKADQIADWRKGRLDEGADLTERPFLSARLARWLANPQAGDTDILAEFRVLQRHGDYSDVLLVDPEGRVRLSLSGLTVPHQAAAQALALALRDRKPMLTDLHAEAHVQTPHIGVVAPLFTGSGQTQQPLGAVVLVSDASQFLYPLIQSWPVPSQTAETLLVRRDGDDVLFLNDLRHQQDAALKLRIPLSRTDVPAVMAVLGKEGIAEGKDYRGVEVMSVILPIADSPWFIVAKVDAAEAFAVWRFSSVLILALLLGFVALAGVAGLVAWQRNQKAYYRALYRSEAALRASVERHSITLKSIGDAVIATDGQGRVELLNSVAEALTGWKNEEARGQPLEQVFCIVNEETRDNVENPVARVLREGLVVGLANHTLLIARDGTERPIADSGAPIRDEQGNITGIVLVFRDQTEKRRAEEALRRSEENFRRSLDDSPLGVRIVTIEGETIYANRAILDIYGYDSVEDLKTTPVAKRYTPESHADFLIRREKRQQGVDVPSEYTINIIRKDGEVRHLQVCRKEVLWDGEIQYQVIYQDITERKQAEEALRESEERLRTIIEASLDAIIAVNTEGQLVLFNGAAQELFQYSEEEALNQPADILLREEMGKIHQERLERFLKRGVGQCGHIGRRMEKLFRRKDGSLFEAEVSMSGGRLNGLRLVVLAIHDITERKQAEEKIKASLLEKETMLKEIHHRVKNNLQVISSLLTLQSSYLQDEKAKELFRNSIDQVKTMANIHTMLYKSEDLSRVDFGGFIRDLAGRLQQSYGIAGSRVEIHVNVSDVSLTIETSIPCGLILNELVSNAIKHAFPEARGGEINISMTTAGEQFVLTVQDNGIGFPEALDFQNTKSLGLELVNLLVGQINGTIDLQVDGGTTLTITFPAVSKGG